MTEGMMGRTSDTRIYNPRSESSTMFRNNDGDGNYNPGDPKYEEQEKEKKQAAREKQAKKERSRKHIKVRPSMLRDFDSDEDGIDDSKKVDADREIHAQTGAAGNFGFLSSLAGGAKGPGAARGEMVAMGEAMDVSFRLLKEEMDEFVQRQIAMQEAEQAANARAAQQVQDRMTAVPCPTCNAQVGEPCIGLNPNLGYPAHVKRMTLAHKSEPMDDAWSELLKQGLTPTSSFDLAPSMTRGAGEEMMPVQDDVPMVDDDVNMGGGNLDCDCAERVREYEINQLNEEIKYANDLVLTEGYPEAARDNWTRDLMREISWTENASCEEIENAYRNTYNMMCVTPALSDEDQMKYTSEPMDDAWSELLKSKAKDRAKRRKKEAQKKFKPSTGEFKRPVGGYDPKSATSRRAKFKSRALGGKTKRTGLGRAHLAVEMEHRGIKTKQPLRLEDPRKYMQQIGRQQVRVQQGQVRTPASPSIPQISGYSTRGAPKPKLKPMRAPPINPPVIAGAPHLNMSGGTTGMGMGASAPPPPMPIMASEDLHSGSDLQKRFDWATIQQLRHMLSESKKLLREKERKRKGKGDADTSGGGTMLPNHPSNGPKQTTRPSGATEDAKNDPRHFGAHTIGNDVGRGGRTA
tara:strand:- start:1473 stop:3371 length:1899 start_codon:yes stop_codon:yes gene_type:complete